MEKKIFFFLMGGGGGDEKIKKSLIFFKKGKNVLVTGAMGLVGGHLTEKLIGLGANVYITYRSTNPRSYFYGKDLDSKVVSADCDIKSFQRVFDIVSKS